MIEIWLLLATFIGQFIILIIGYSIFHFLPHKDDYPTLQKLAISYGLGLGFLGFSMLLFILLGLHSRLSFLPLIIGAIIVFLYFKIYKSLINDIKDIFRTFRKLKLNYIEYFCIVLIIIELIVMISLCYIYPISYWDEFGIWDSKARNLFYDGNFNFIIFAEYVSKPNYPPLLSLITTFFYSLYFYPHHFSKFTNVFVFLSLIIFIYYSLRHSNLNRTYSILITTFVAMVWEVFRYSSFLYADVLVTFFYTISTVFLFNFVISKKKYHLFYSAIFMGFMALSKQEGLGLTIVNLGIFTLYNIYLILKKKNRLKNSFKEILILVSISVLIYIPWYIFCIFNGISDVYSPNILRILDLSYLLNRFIKIILFLPEALFWCYYWIIFLIIVVFNIKYIFKEKTFFLLLLCLFHFLLYIFIYLITPEDLLTQLKTSLNRELLHITPISAILLGTLLKNNKNILIDFNKKESSIYKLTTYIFLIILIIFVIIYIPFALIFNLYYFTSI